MAAAISIHASAVLVGARAVLIRGPSGSGKSQLTLALLQSSPPFPFVRLVADDRTIVEAAHGRLLVRPPANLAGLIEVRGLGIQTVPYEAAAVAFLVVGLAAEAARLPAPQEQTTIIEGVSLRYLAVGPEVAALPLVRAAIAAPSAWG